MKDLLQERRAILIKMDKLIHRLSKVESEIDDILDSPEVSEAVENFRKKNLKINPKSK